MGRHRDGTFADVNAIKADFNDIYRRADPRSYYTVLGALDYVIPEVAKPVFLQLAERCIEERGRPITVLDLGCSYGVNAAMMRYDIGLRQLRERYLAPAIQSLAPGSMIDFDARYFRSWPARSDIRFIGLDCSPEAIAYACAAGLLATGAAVDLETQPLGDAARSLVSQADLIISTGCVGYVTEKTFDALLAAMEPSSRPWVASFVLRMFDYGAIERSLSRHHLQTEKWPGATFVQRRFRDALELSRTTAALEARGLDPAGKEADGLLHAELFVSRPDAEVGRRPLTELLSLTSGGGRKFGDRCRLPSERAQGEELAA